jgi:two-component system, chemotaxis family, chemotaxis protein CheY
MLEHVLVVDDSELLHGVYRFLLKKFCRSVSCVKNGREACDFLAREGEVDLVFLDLRMPVMDGLQFLEAIRSERRFAHLPVVIVTSEGEEKDVQRGLQLGARGCLYKPFDHAALQQAIEQIYDRPA